MSNDERKAIVKKALNMVTTSSKFADLIQTGNESVEFWERMIKATDSPWDTVADFYDTWKKVGGQEHELGERLEEILSDKKTFLANVDRISVFVDAGKVAYNCVNANKLTSSESVEAIADILKFGKGLAEVTGAMKALDGVGSMLDFYSEALIAISQKMQEIEDDIARKNVKAMSYPLCQCPPWNRSYHVFSYKWSQVPNSEKPTK